MELKSLDLEEGKISYEFRKGKGPCLVFIHGLGSNHSIWIPYFEYFKDYSILALDHRGHGRSNLKLNDFDDLSEDIKKVVDKEGIKEVVMVGSCMGVRVIFDFYNKYPELVKKAVLIVPYGQGSVRFTPVLKLLSNVMLFLGNFERKIITRYHDYWDSNGNLKDAYPFFKEIKNMHNKLYFNLLKFLLNNKLNFNLRIPFLILFGKHDFFIKNKKVIKSLKKNEYFNYKFLDTHHLITTRKPKTVCKLIEEFTYARHNNTNSE